MKEKPVFEKALKFADQQVDNALQTIAGPENNENHTGQKSNNGIRKKNAKKNFNVTCSASKTKQEAEETKRKIQSPGENPRKQNGKL